MTRDGVAVLHHDGSFRARGDFGRPELFGRLPGGVPGGRLARVWESDHADLPAWLPSLDELYETCGSTYELSLDLKGSPAMADEGARAAIAAARRAGGGAIGRLWLCGTVRQLQTWRGWDGEVRLANSAHGADIPGESRISTHALALADAGAQALNLRAPFWTGRKVEAVHSAGLLAFAWDAQRRNTLDRLLLTEAVDAVYSDHVHRLMRSVFRARERRNTTAGQPGAMAPRDH